MLLKDATDKAITALTAIIDDQNATTGFKLEASREILKYSSMMADLERMQAMMK